MADQLTMTDLGEPYPSAIAVYCDTCGTEVQHDYVVTDTMDKFDRYEVARKWLAEHEGWLNVIDDDFCLNCRPAAGLLHAAAQRLRDVAPQILMRLSGLADPVAGWLDQVAERHEQSEHRGVLLPGCRGCTDEEWPCGDMQVALRVARTILAGEEWASRAE